MKKNNTNKRQKSKIKIQEEEIFPEQTKTRKGITLISLIVTIIIMLLLIIISVMVVINGDLLGTTKRATTLQEDETVIEKIQEMVLGKYDLSNFTLPENLGTIVLNGKVYTVTASTTQVSNEGLKTTITLANGAEVVNYDLENDLRIKMEIGVASKEEDITGTYYVLGDRGENNYIDVKNNGTLEIGETPSSAPINGIWTYNKNNSTVLVTLYMPGENIDATVSYIKIGNNRGVLVPSFKIANEYELYAKTSEGLHPNEWNGSYVDTTGTAQITINSNAGTLDVKERENQTDSYEIISSGANVPYAIYNGKIYTKYFKSGTVSEGTVYIDDRTYTKQ